MTLYLYLFGMLFPVHTPQQTGAVAAAMVYPPCGAGLKSHLHEYLPQQHLWPNHWLRKYILISFSPPPKQAIRAVPVPTRGTRSPVYR